MTIVIPVASRTGLSSPRSVFADVFVYAIEGKHGLWRRTRRTAKKSRILQVPPGNLLAVWREGNGSLMEFVPFVKMNEKLRDIFAEQDCHAIEVPVRAV